MYDNTPAKRSRARRFLHFSFSLVCTFTPSRFSTTTMSSESTIPPASTDVPTVGHVCASCNTIFKENDTARMINGQWTCCVCVTCPVCKQALGTGSVRMFANSLVHQDCALHQSCGKLLHPDNTCVRPNGTIACNYCTGCQCGRDACVYRVDRPVGYRYRFQLRVDDPKYRCLIVADGKMVIPEHRLCGEEGCNEWCERTDELGCDRPRAAVICVHCRKAPGAPRCVHASDGVCPMYSGTGSDGIMVVDPPVGHIECVKCNKCGQYASHTAKTNNAWVYKDGVLTHASCFACEDPACGKTIKYARFTRVQDEAGARYVHTKCYRADKKRKAELQAAGKNKKLKK